MTKPGLFIASLADVERIAAMRRPLPRITLAPGLASSSRGRVIEANLNRYRSPCGCTTSAVFMVSAIVWMIAMGRSWWVVCAAGLAAGTIGKLVGIAIGRLLFRHWLQQAMQHVSAARPASPASA